MTTADIRVGALNHRANAGVTRTITHTWVDEAGDPIDDITASSLWLGGTTVDQDDFTGADEIEGVVDDNVVTFTLPVPADLDSVRLRTSVDGELATVGILAPSALGSESLAATIVRLGGASVTIQTVPGDGGGGGGVTVHNNLTGRSADDAHPKSAITGLVADLTAISSTFGTVFGALGGKADQTAVDDLAAADVTLAGDIATAQATADGATTAAGNASTAAAAAQADADTAQTAADAAQDTADAAEPKLRRSIASNDPVLLVDAGEDPIAVYDTADWDDFAIREPDGPVYDPETDSWICCYSAQSTTLGGATRIAAAISPTGEPGTWTSHPDNPIATELEDPYLARNLDGTLYRDSSGRALLYGEEKSGSDHRGIELWRSDPDTLDGWAEYGRVLDRGSVGEWDETDRTSPTVIHVHGLLYMLYEGRSLPGQEGMTGYAVSTDAGGTSFTADPDPVVSDGAVPDDIRFFGGRWVLITHAPDGSTAGRYATTDDPADWTDGSFYALPGNPFEHLGATTIMFYGADDETVLYDVPGTELRVGKVRSASVSLPYETPLAQSPVATTSRKVPTTRTIAGLDLSADRTAGAVKTALTLVKGDVGLGNVDNTSDANKPVSTATQTALDAKVPTTRTVAGLDLSANRSASDLRTALSLYSPVVKPSDTARTDSVGPIVPAADPHLTKAVPTGTYVVTARLPVTGGNNTPDIQVALTGGTVTFDVIAAAATVTAGSAAMSHVGHSTGTHLTAGTGSYGTYVLIQGVCTLASSGTIAVSWAQASVSAQATTVLAGAVLQVEAA